MTIIHPRIGSGLHPALNVAVVGPVGHGKTTLIGCLLHDAGALPADTLGASEVTSAPPGLPAAWAVLFDAGERGAAAPGLAAHVRFATAGRDYAIVEAPGHGEIREDTIGAAAGAVAAILVIDALEGAQESTRRQCYLLHLLGIRQVAVAVTKMDLVDYAEARFAEVARQASEQLEEIGLAPLAAIPVSGQGGDNMAQAAARTPWYRGPSLLEALRRFEPAVSPAERPLRFPIEEAREIDGRHVLVGRVESGVLRVGDTLLFSPSNKSAKVQSIEVGAAAAAPLEARAGSAVGVTLDGRIFIERGEIASHPERPPLLTTVFRAALFWLGHRPLEAGQTYKFKLATRELPVTVQSIETVIGAESRPGAAGRVERNQIAEIVLRSRGIVALDEFRDNPACGRFTLFDGGAAAGGGTVSMEGYPDQRQLLGVKSTNLTSVEHGVTAASRAQRNGHLGGVMWLTGLSGAGKSTLAMAVEQNLFAKGYHVYVLDGDNVRRGLNANLGFSPDDRAENIRRVGEVAALFADAGFLCISAFISPYEADRDRARRAAGKAFHEIYIKADLATCERRDPKGLYKKARAGQIADFTGVSAPYEPPRSPELAVDTATHSVEDCVRQIVAYVENAFALR